MLNSTHKEIRLHELPKIFPEAKPTVERLLKEADAEYKMLQSLERKIKNYIRAQPISVKEKKTLQIYMIIPITMEPRIKLKAKIKRLKKTLSYYEKPKRFAPLNVEQAREVRVTDYVSFNNTNFARCIWHNEKTPSMKYYPKDNRVHCFGCGKGGDVIEVVQHLYNLNFIDTVKLLSHGTR